MTIIWGNRTRPTLSNLAGSARLCRANANVEQGYLVHLYRLSQPGAKFSGRDWALASKQIVSKEQVAMMSRGRSVEIFYGMVDGTGGHENGVWRIVAEGIVNQMSM